MKAKKDLSVRAERESKQSGLENLNVESLTVLLASRKEKSLSHENVKQNLSGA